MNNNRFLVALLIAMLFLFPALANANSGDFAGGVAIGTSYAGIITAPSNGLAVQGKIGIGTAAPINSLDIYGAAVIGTSYAGVNTAPTNGLLVQGKVGIGTSSPLYVEDVWQAGNQQIRAMSTGANNSQITIDNLAGGNQSALILSDAGTGKWEFGKQTDNTLFMYDIHNAKNFMTVSTGGQIAMGETTNQMILPAAGGVGIGTLSPLYLLDVWQAGNQQIRAMSTGANNSQITIDNTAGSNQSALILSDAGVGKWEFGKQTDNTLFMYDVPNAKNFMTVSTGGQLALGETSNQLVLPAAGNVGIGNASPHEALQIGSLLSIQPSTVDAAIRYNAYWNGSNWIYLTNTNKANQIFMDSTGQHFMLSNTAGTAGGTITDMTERFTIASGGNVGIGNTSPSAKLDVNGTVKVGTFTTASSTTVCQNGNVLSTCSSSIRYKTNVKPSSFGLKEVLRMQPVTFDFRDHKDNWEKHDFGFVAEDLEQINPVFVTYNENGRVEGVRYMQLTAVNTKAIQELNGMINKQQAEIDELRRAVEQLTHSK